MPECKHKPIGGGYEILRMELGVGGTDVMSPKMTASCIFTLKCKTKITDRKDRQAQGAFPAISFSVFINTSSERGSLLLSL